MHCTECWIRLVQSCIALFMNDQEPPRVGFAVIFQFLAIFKLMSKNFVINLCWRHTNKVLEVAGAPALVLVCKQLPPNEMKLEQ